MISFPLTLRLAPAPVHSPTAWFIPGDDPQGWLEEILHWWGTPAAKLRFFVVPASVRDRSPIGVLVRIEGNLPPTAVLRAQPYGLLGDRLFVPVDAVLEIPVSDSELRQKLPLDLYVMHPSAGLIGFAQGEAL